MGSTAEWKGERRDRTIGNPQFEQERENRLKKNSQSFRDLWDANKRSNICVIQAQKEGGTKKVLKKEWLTGSSTRKCTCQIVKKRTINSDSYTYEVSFRNEGETRHSQMKEDQENM